jgi:hypothetical protein
VRRHAISGKTAVKSLDAQLAQLMAELQYREITPEDYDLLLELDAQIKPKYGGEAEGSSGRHGAQWRWILCWVPLTLHRPSSYCLHRTAAGTVGSLASRQANDSDLHKACGVCMDDFLVSTSSGRVVGQRNRGRRPALAWRRRQVAAAATPGSLRSFVPKSLHLQASDELMALPSCGHEFHAACITRWLKDFGNTCPVDGREVDAA